jgi:RNA polymerase primary sigma factor
LPRSRRASSGAGAASAASDVKAVPLPARKAANSNDGQLSAYFRNLAEHDLLSPDEEKSLSENIERQETHAWKLALENPDAAPGAVALISGQLEEPVAFDRVLRAAEAVRSRRRDLRARKRLDEAAADAARKVRALDLDRVHIDAVVRACERALAGEGPIAKPAAAQARAFAAFVEELGKTHRGSSALRDEFVRCNLRLVVTMARRYDRGGMPLSDLIQEGNLGLMHSVGRFDYRRGLRFSTYACWWIRHAIGRALADKARAVRIPVHMLEAQQQLEKVRQQLVRDLGRPPSPQELAKGARVPLAKLNQMHRFLMGHSVSLDKPVHSDDDRAYGDLLADPLTEDASPADDMTTTALSKQVTSLLSGLSPIEADVLRKRFGLRDDEERTFREIGDEYSLSRERIRQIQNSALEKLKRAMEREHRGHVDL